MRMDPDKYELLLAKNKYSNDYVRKAAGLSPATLCRAKNGLKIEAKTLGKIAEVLNVSALELRAEEE